jgi:hypothetical protein
MKFSIFLKKLLNQFVEDYQQAYAKTFGYAMLWTIVCFAIGQLLAAYSNYDPSTTIQPLSILSYFSLNFSMNTTYSFVDDFKILFVFFVALFSANLIKKISFSGVMYLVFTLIVCVLIDLGLFLLGAAIAPVLAGTKNSYLFHWVFSIMALLRLYTPYLLFALTIQLTSSRLRLGFAKFCYLFIAIWLFYEISYEATRFLRDNLFALVLVPFKTKIYSYVLESLLGLPLIASFFVGFYTAMTGPFSITEEKN